MWGVRRGGHTLPVYADEEARGQLQASSTALHINLLRQDLPLCLELGISARPDSHSNPLGSPCLHPLSAGLTGVCLYA